MDPVSAVIAFSLAAALLVITPGLDTALVLRTAAVEGPRPALQAGAGVSAGVLLWGLIASLGLGALLAVSETAYMVLKVVGSLYLLWLGGRMLLAALRPGGGAGAAVVAPRNASAGNWFWRGLMTNLLNPKVGLFYVTFLPQFVPPDMPVVAFSFGLAAIHVAMGMSWFALLVGATRPFARVLQSPTVRRALDGLTGCVLVAFGLRLALERRG